MRGQRFFCCILLVLAISGSVLCKRRKPDRERYDDGIDDEEVFKYIKNHTDNFITAPAGVFQGKYYRGINSEYFQSFAEIPYAYAPVGTRRFQKPEPLGNGSQFFDVSKSMEFKETIVRCKQYARWQGHASNAPDKILGEEGCLLLDIIRPVGLALEHKRRQMEDIIVPRIYEWAPVLVFLHPGTFTYDLPMNHYRIAEYLCCNQLVFVFVRFRLGPFGFANLGPLSSGGIVPNVGMWDQVAALKWVQQNIIRFTGNPGRVTLAGVAAGAASVNFHMLSEASRGLFRQAISIGGSALNPWALAKESIKNTKYLIEPCAHNNTDLYEGCLIHADADSLLKRSAELYVYQNLPNSLWGPVEDLDFLIADPELLMRNKHIHPVPWLVSFSNDFSLYPNYEFIEQIHTEYDHEKWFELAPVILELKNQIDPYIMREVAWNIREHYDPVDEKNKTDNLTRQRFTMMVSDRWYTNGILDAVYLHSRAMVDVIWEDLKRIPGYPRDELPREPAFAYTFLYRYDYKFSRMTDFLSRSVDRWADSHREEFSLITRDPVDDHDDDDDSTTEAPKTEEEEAEAFLRSAIVTSWGSFIRYGAPTIILSDYVKLKPTYWLSRNFPATHDMAYTYIKYDPNNINNSAHLRNTWWDSQLKFWRTIPFQYYSELEDLATVNFSLADDDDNFLPKVTPDPL